MTPRLILVAILAGFLLVVPGASTADAKTCEAPTYPVAGGTYSGLTAKKCKKATAVVKKFYACRTKTGPTGRCVSLVKGFACREERTTEPTGAISAKVDCSKNKLKVSFRYSQPAAA
jgi:hypothetical protein